MLPPTRSKEDVLSETSEQYLGAANDTLDIFKSEKPVSANKLHHLSYNFIRSKYSLQSQLVQDARRDVWVKRKHGIGMFRSMPITYNVPRSGSFKATERGNPVISIATTNGRIAIPIRQDGGYKRFQEFQNSGYSFTEFKLKRRAKNWIVLVSLHKTFEVEDRPNVIGVDVGTRVLAAVSIIDGCHIARQLYFGRDVSQVKRDIGVRRSILQSKGTDRARRALRNLRGYEANFTRTRCYQIAHEIVRLAVQHNATIAIENLKGLNGTKLGTKTDRKVKRTPYHEFRQALESVASQNGVNVVTVSPRDTSKTCYRCGSVSRNNRKSQALFSCDCGFEANADRVASVNIGSKLRFSKLGTSPPTTSKLLMERGEKELMQTKTQTSCFSSVPDETSGTRLKSPISGNSQTQISMSRMPVNASSRVDEKNIVTGSQSYQSSETCPHL